MILAQIGVAPLSVSQARDLETQNRQKILKIWDSEYILRTIWLPSLYGTQKNLSLLFFVIKALLKGCFVTGKTPKFNNEP